MDIDMIAKLGALLIGAVSTLKLTYDWLYSRQGRIREEYKFAREFFLDMERYPKMHPFLKEKGFQAIAGDTRLAACEIEYLLGLNGSPQALRDYVLGRPYLQYFSTAGNEQISFRAKYKSHWSRLWRKICYLILYFISFAAAFTPLLMPAVRAMPPVQALGLFAFTFMLFSPPSFIALRAGIRIARAEALLESQQKSWGQAGMRTGRSNQRCSPGE
jgi:hypothetical protein